MYSAEDVIVTMPGAFDARSVLVKLTESDDRKALTDNAEIGAVFDFITSRNVVSVSALVKLRPINHFKRYNALPSECRNVVRRLMNWPRCWTTVYPLLEEDAWFQLAKLSLGKSLFDSEGGGVWLEKHRKALYRRIVTAVAPLWGKAVGNDGIIYDSVAEAVHGSLLFHNRKLLTYIYKPKLLFNGTGNKVPRHCDGDFKVEVLPGVPNRLDSFYVENWMRFDIAENWESKDASTISSLKQRRFKINQYERLGQALVQTESQVHRDQGSEAYVAHLKKAYREQAGIEQDTTGFTLPKAGMRSDADLTASELASVLLAHGAKTVIQATQNRDGRIKGLASRIYKSGQAEAVEHELARLQGRMPRTLIGKWKSSASQKDVFRYAQEHGLKKAAYELAYAKGSLPFGFPASPGQQWPETWSWLPVRGDYPASRRIRDYQSARHLVQKWQLRTGTRLTSARTFERERDRSRILRRIPKQPDNPKSGGLDGWPKKHGWDDFLGCSTQRDAEICHAWVQQLIKEISPLNAREAVVVLIRAGLDRSSKVQSCSKLYRELRARADWREILDLCARRPHLIKDPEKIVEILVAQHVFSEAEFHRKRQDDQNLLRIPHHIQRIGSDLFERARAMCGMPKTKKKGCNSTSPSSEQHVNSW